MKKPTNPTLANLSAGVWLNEPKLWCAREGTLEVTTDAASDFWQETHYGFSRDSGHFLAFATPAEFSVQLRVQADYEQLYDQAGIMVRLDAERWLKAGVELSDGRAMLSSVLTNERSDWATAPFAGDARDFFMRVTLSNGVLRVQFSADGVTWPLARLAPFPRATSYQAGPMCCTPERAGLAVRFSEFRLGAPLGKALHDLT